MIYITILIKQLKNKQTNKPSQSSILGNCLKQQQLWLTVTQLFSGPPPPARPRLEITTNRSQGEGGGGGITQGNQAFCIPFNKNQNKEKVCSLFNLLI